jgi:hypothetical protein
MRLLRRRRWWWWEWEWWRSRHSLYLLDISVCALFGIDSWVSLIATFGEALMQTGDS